MINVRMVNVSDDDSFLMQCFKNYCCKNAAIEKSVYECSIKDMNDYKTVAAIGYLLLSNEKREQILNDFKDGLSRISKKDAKSSTLIYDQLALVGIIVAIKEYQVAEYYEWLHSILFEAEAYCVRSSKDTIFIKILKAYFDGQTYPVDVQFRDSILIIWLSTFSKEKIDTYKEQANLIQKVWKCEEYLFDDILYNGICTFLVDRLIQDKFEFGIISIEQKYKNAVNHCKVIAKSWAERLTIISILVIVCLILLLSYLAWSYAVLSNDKMWYVPLIFNIISVIGIPYGLITHKKKIYDYLEPKIFSYVMKVRRLD